MVCVAVVAVRTHSEACHRGRPGRPGYATISRGAAARFSFSLPGAVAGQQLSLTRRPAPTDHSVHQQIAARDVRNMARNNRALNEVSGVCDASQRHYFSGHKTWTEGRDGKQTDGAREKPRNRDADQLKFAQQSSTRR